MKFIKFNFLDGSTFTFCLDYVVSIASEGTDTMVKLTNGDEQLLPYETESFIANVFSDLHGDSEYQLLDIEELGPDEPINLANFAV